MNRRRGVIRQVTSHEESVFPRPYARARRGQGDNSGVERAIIDTSGDAIISTDLGGCIRSWNAAAERLLERSAADMVGQPINLIIPPARQRDEANIRLRVLGGESVDHYETERLRRDGSSVAVSVRLSPVIDGAGQVIGFSEIARDDSERRLREAQLAGERRAFELLATGASLSEILRELVETLESQEEGLVSSILLLDDDGMRLRHVAAPSLSPTYISAVDGLKIGPAAGSCGTAAYRGESVIVADIASDPLWSPFPDLRALALSLQLRSCWSTPILSGQRKVLGTFALYFNEARTPTTAQVHFTELVSRTAAMLIELKRADEAQARLTAIVNSSDDAIIGMTPDGLIVNWSSSSGRLTGYGEAEMTGEVLYRLVPPDREDEVRDNFMRVRAGERIPAFDSVIVNRSGDEVGVSVRLSPITDEHGVLIGVSAIMRDISERQALERMQQEFLAMVSHELRNPLTVMKGFASILHRSRRFDDEAVDALYEHMIVFERLVNDLLDASRVQIGHLQLVLREVDIAQQVQACSMQARRLTSSNDIVVEAPTTRRLVGRWDAVRLRQVLLNLLSNAIKYSPQGRILVRVSDRGSEVRVDVVDEGIGIAPDKLPLLFQRFYRAGAGVYAPRSLGLGLYIARGIVESHGGRIWAESEGEGRGSTFSFTLPFRPEAQCSPADASTGTSAAA